MKTLLLDVKTNTCEEHIVFPDVYPNYWDKSNVLYTTLIAMEIGSTKFYAMCDDLAFMQDDPHISAITPEGEIVSAGSLMFFRLESNFGEKTKFTRTLPFDAELTELSDEELAVIKSHIRTIPTKKHPEGLVMLCGATRSRTGALGLTGGYQKTPFMLQDEALYMNTQTVAEQLQGGEAIDFGRGYWEI
jgi:hypothetical protein